MMPLFRVLASPRLQLHEEKKRKRGRGKTKRGIYVSSPEFGKHPQNPKKNFTSSSSSSPPAVGEVRLQERHTFASCFLLALEQYKKNI